MRYIEMILKDIEELEKVARDLSTSELDQRKVNKLFVSLGSYVELMMKSVLLPSLSNGDGFAKYIAEFESIYGQDNHTLNLDRIRNIYNSAKHNPNSENSIIEFKEVLEKWRQFVAITYKSGNFVMYESEKASTFKRVFWGAVWDHYTGGDSEISIFLPSYDESISMLKSIDLFYIKMNNWDQLQRDLSKKGRFRKEKDCFPSKVYEFYSKEGDFLSFFEFEGEYKDLVSTISKHKLEQELLPGLNRADQVDSMSQACLVSTLEAAKSFKERPNLDELFKRVQGMASNLFGVANNFKRLDDYIVESCRILEIDFSLWKYIKGPRWISRSSFEQFDEDEILIKSSFFILSNDLNVYIW